jgi:uncharacterized protein YfdQ (DUF2303 family)
VDRNDLAALGRAVLDIIQREAPDQSHKGFAGSLTPESLATAKRLIDTGALAPAQKSFVDFVELCARKEAETGKPCRIVASY